MFPSNGAYTFPSSGCIPTPFPIASDAKASSFTSFTGITFPETGAKSAVPADAALSDVFVATEFVRFSLSADTLSDLLSEALSSNPTIIVSTVPSTNATAIEIKSPINCVICPALKYAGSVAIPGIL